MHARSFAYVVIMKSMIAPSWGRGKEKNIIRNAKQLSQVNWPAWDGGEIIKLNDNKLN